MKTLRLKLISLIAMVCLVLGLVVVGIYAAEIQYIKLGGNVTFNVDDKSLYVQDVRMQEDMNSSTTPYSLKEKGKFMPGYINGEFNMNLGTYNNTYGGIIVYFDIINTVDESGISYIYDVSASTTQTDGEIEVQAVVDNDEGYIPFGSITPSEITSTTSPTATVILTITSSQGVEVDLSQITITFTDPVYYDFTFTTDDQTGTATLDSYTGNASEVIIPNTISVLTINDQTLYLQGNQYEVTAIRDGSSDTDGVFYNNRSNLTSVTLPEKIQSIGAYAFYYCTGLTSLTLSENLTSIGDYAFAHCLYLTEINYNIPSLPDLSYNSNVFRNAGQSGTGITVIFGDNVERIPGNLFSTNYSNGLINVKTINFSSSITSIGDIAFNACENIQTVNYLGTMSQWCAINFGSQYSNPIYYAESLVIDGQEISGNLDLDEVTSITGKYTFAGYDKITSVTLPESLESIAGSHTFYNCQNVTEINFNASSFIDLSSSRSIFFGAGQSGIGLTINVGNKVEHIPAYLFFSCSNATTVNFPETLQSIGAYAFYYCNGLTSITLPEKIQSIGDYAFSDSDGLTRITLSGNITSIGDYAFAHCLYLTEINYNIPSLSDLSYDSNVFRNAGQSGTGITVIFGDNVERIPGYLFSTNYSNGLINVKTINFSSSITSIGNSAFNACENIQTVNYPGTMSQWCAINFGSSTSNPAYYTTSLVIDGEEVPENFILPGEVTSIGAHAFAGYSKLKSVTLSDTLQTIGAYAFSNCDGLTSITLPESLQSIGTSAFYSCTNLTTVIIESETIYNLATSSSACGYLLQNATTVRVLTDFASDSHSYINTTNFPNVDKNVVIDGKTYWAYTK